MKTSNYGIGSHSTGQSYIIFSVYRKDKTEKENNENHHKVLNELTTSGIGFKSVDGYYENKQEKSIIINAIAVVIARHYCRSYYQESYLLLHQHIHGLQKAYIVTYDTAFGKEYWSEQFIGYLREVPRELIDAGVFSAFTYRPDMKIYWAVTHKDYTRADQIAAYFDYLKSGKPDHFDLEFKQGEPIVC